MENKNSKQQTNETNEFIHELMHRKDTAIVFPVNVENNQSDNQNDRSLDDSNKMKKKNKINIKPKPKSKFKQQNQTTASVKTKIVKSLNGKY